MTKKLEHLKDYLLELKGAVVACSGGLDSLVLSAISHQVLNMHCSVIHAVSPAVPVQDTARLRSIAENQAWNLRVIQTGEFRDENYLTNPQDRCFYCKTHLYGALQKISHELSEEWGQAASVLSGTNMDDLTDFRPGLEAAKNYGVKHPFVEAGLSKKEIRLLAHDLGLAITDLPASPCLSSRIYTGTRVTEERLKAIDEGEMWIRRETGLQVVRCRVRNNEMLIELESGTQEKLDEEVLTRLRADIMAHHPWVQALRLDPKPYAPGRAFGLRP